MPKTYFGFAIADSMFMEACTATRQPMAAVEVQEVLMGGNVGFILNPSHVATIDAAIAKFGFFLSIPDKPIKVALVPGDKVIVMSHDLPRLNQGRAEYTAEEIAQATFRFGVWTVVQ